MNDEDKYKALKLYIAVLDEFPDHMTPTLVAHAVLAADEKFGWESGKDFYPEWQANYDSWYRHSFKKCVLRVNQKEFDKIKALDNVHVGWENNTLDGKESCIVVCPRFEIPNVLKFAKLWQPKQKE